MRLPHSHRCILRVKVVCQLVFLCLLLTGLTRAQESDSKKVSILIDQLKHRDTQTRRNAAIALGGLGKEAKEAVSQMINALKDPDEPVRYAASYSLGRIGEGAVPQLIAALKDPDAAVRLHAAIALERIVTDKEGLHLIGAVPHLIEALKDPDARVRKSAVTVLSLVNKGGAKEAVPHLIEALKDPDARVRAEAAAALAHIKEGTKEAVPHLIEALEDPEDLVRWNAAEALAELSTILVRERATEFADQLKTAAEIMRKSSDPAVTRYADRIEQQSLLLKLLWWDQLKQWVVTHPTISAAISVYPLLLLIWLALLWLRPLWLLHINEALAKTTEIKLPAYLGGFSVAPRYLLLVGFFHYRARVLDAWVANYVGAARKNFSNLPTVEEREIYVPLPVVIGSESEADLSPNTLRPTFSSSLICVQLSGEGGSGKTALACRLVRWAMSSQKEARLSAEHLMLPVLIEQDLVMQDKATEHPLFRAIKQQVKVMINEDDPPPAGLLLKLLNKRRVLVVIDGFSEMNQASRTATLAGITDLPVNAVIITTRTDEQLTGIPKTEIKPLRVRGNRLSTFMEAYLNARKKRDLFEDDEFFESCRRLSLIVGDRDITALLAKLYAEQMIAVKEKVTDSDAPENIPELMLSYLNDLCRGAGPGDPDIRIVHRAAKSIAWECLKKTLKPTPAQRGDVLTALGGEENGVPLLEYLEERLKLIQTVGVGRDRIRFGLDPLAEYLAGMRLVDKNGEDEQALRNFLAQVDEQGGVAEDIKGFLLAVRECCLAGAAGSQGLRVVADELARRAGINPEESNRYRIERRVKQLISRLKYSEAEDRINAAEGLAAIGSPAKIAVRDLCSLLTDHEKGVRSSAAEALGEIGEGASDAVPQLVSALKDPFDHVRVSAARALGKFGDSAKEAVPQMIEVLKGDPYRNVRRIIAQALGEIGSGAKEAVPQLSEAALKDPDKYGVRPSASIALVKIGKGAAQAVR